MKLYAGGCSFTAGIHPQTIKHDGKSWCNYLGFNEVLNDAWPGNSNTAICRRALEFLAAGEVADFFAIQLTGGDRREILMPIEARSAIFGNEADAVHTQDGTYNINIWSIEKWFPKIKDFYMNHMRGSKIYDDAMSIMHILALQNVLEKRGIPYVFFNGLAIFEYHKGDSDPYRFGSLLEDTRYFMPHTSMKQYYNLDNEHPSELQLMDWGTMLAEYIAKA